MELPSLASWCFYPPRLARRHWLTYYAERFDTVELKTTFSRLPSERVWHGGFREPAWVTFAVKVTGTSHTSSALTEVAQHLSLLYERIEPLLQSPKLGPSALAVAAELPLRPQTAREHPRASPGWSSTCLRIPASLLVSHRDVLAVTTARSGPGDCRPSLREHLPSSRKNHYRLHLLCDSTAVHVAGTETTRAPNSASGPDDSIAGRRRSTSSHTSTTTGRDTRLTTPAFYKNLSSA